MMKVAVFEARGDEQQYLADYANALDMELVVTSEIPSPENVGLVLGCEGVTTLGQGSIDRELLSQWKQAGVQALATRTVGYDHIDLSAARELDIRVCNAAYAPNGVADFTVMLMLMSLRNYKQAMWRGQVNDFSLQGLQGKELKDQTVGIMGTGRIGVQVMRNLSGFGCRLLCYDVYRNEAAAALGTYVELDELYRESDVITLHLPLLESTYHIINDESLAKMKDGVVLINCARGELTDIETLIQGIETEKIGALGMDTVEGDEGIIHADHRIDILANRNWFYLHQFRNVIMTQHMAFYTDAAVRDMVRSALEGLEQMSRGERCATQLV